MFNNIINNIKLRWRIKAIRKANIALEEPIAILLYKKEWLEKQINIINQDTNKSKDKDFIKVSLKYQSKLIAKLEEVNNLLQNILDKSYNYTNAIEFLTKVYHKDILDHKLALMIQEIQQMESK